MESRFKEKLKGLKERALGLFCYKRPQKFTFEDARQMALESMGEAYTSMNKAMNTLVRQAYSDLEQRIRSNSYARKEA